MLLAATQSTNGEDPKKSAVTITPTRAWGNVFGDQEIEFKFRVDAANAVKGKVVWRLAAGTATIKGGEADLAANPNGPADIAIKLPVPPVKDGIIFHTRLTLSALESGEKKPAASFEKDLWIFPKDPFVDRSEWLKKLKITLYDPKGDTAKVFSAAKIPYEESRDVDSVAALKEGVLIVGEGVNFKDERSLAATLHKLASNGLTVLCLAPFAGEVMIPGLGGGDGSEEISFRREIVRKLDKRLDPDGWLPDGKALASSVVVKMGEEGVAGEVVQGSGGWPWIEARFGTGKGRWAVCGLAVVSKWEAGPTPRFLLARVLEYLTQSDIEQTKKENER
jgi:hypothetical protein